MYQSKPKPKQAPKPKKDNWIVCGDGRVYNTTTGQYKQGTGGAHLYMDEKGVLDYKKY